MRRNQLGKGRKEYHSRQSNIFPLFSPISCFGDQHRYLYVKNADSLGTSYPLPMDEYQLVLTNHGNAIPLHQ